VTIIDLWIDSVIEFGFENVNFALAYLADTAIGRVNKF